MFLARNRLLCLISIASFFTSSLSWLYSNTIRSNRLILHSRWGGYNIERLSHPRAAGQILSSKDSNNSADKDAEELRRQAEKLRQEIKTFEQEKIEEEENINRIEQQVQTEKQAVKDTYSAILPILKPDGTTLEEKVEFVPVTTNSYITVMEGALPLSMILGENDHEKFGTVVTVDEVVSGGNADLAGVQVGDILRATTACKVEMSMPTWQLLAGGIGQPKTVRFIYSVDSRPFDEVMEAIASNRMDPEERTVLLVVERQR